MPDQRLSGKIALVTGAGRGIGRVIALRLAQDGADVIVHYANSRAGADETVAGIEAMGRKAVAYQADIADRAQVRAMFAEIDANPGRIDIVVNNSGVSSASTLADVTDEDIEHIFGVNTFGPLYVASEAAKRLPDGGRIINFSSSAAHHPMAGAGLYMAAKRAVESFTENWARELGKRGITVNTVVPGATSPGMIDGAPQYVQMYEKVTPAGRIGTAEEIAALVAFLASPEASWVTGGSILANGAGDM
jgi:3-oxoacyl-[acyl-carrier protein] reductase